MNENYDHPEKPDGCEDGIIKGLYKLKEAENPSVRLVGSGSILRESVKAVEVLSKYKINAEVWSATSFNLLRKDGMEVERENRLNPTKEAKIPYVTEQFSDSDTPIIASTDYMRSYAEQIRPYVDSEYYVLGTDGYGRSDSRESLRSFFEIDANNIAATAAYALFKKGDIDKKEVNKIYKDLGIDASKPNPWEV